MTAIVEAGGKTLRAMKTLYRTGLIVTLLRLCAVDVSAQDLSPRSYWPAPKGTKVGVVGYQYSSGDVVIDPSIPVIGVDSRLNATLLAYRQTLSLWGRTTNLIVELPYAWGTTLGTIQGELRRRDLAGLGDIGATLSVNLLGAPTMTPADFQELRRKPRPILGASVKILAPIGAYDPDKVINVSGNRWAVKAELGYTLPIRPAWLLEFQLGSWFFGDNHDFVGMTRKQRSIVAFQFHLIRRVKPGFWASLDANYFEGGRNILDGQVLEALQRNSRLGVTVVFPFHGRHAVKAGYSRGIVTASGQNFESILFSYQQLFR